ncbi:MAG: ATP-binding protein [Firmicutes bacterium]|nr:ATP-binding protein [Bacillota bacterium]
MDMDFKPKRPTGLNRLYVTGVLLAVIWILFRAYRIVSDRMVDLDTTSRWTLVALGLANTLAIATLLFIIARTLGKLYFERRQGILGSRIRTRLVLAFFVVCLTPSLMLFLMGRNFISKNVRRWFLPETQEVIVDGNRLAKTYRSGLESDLKTAMGRLSATGVDDLAFRRPYLGLDLLARQEGAKFQVDVASDLPTPDLNLVVDSELNRQELPGGLWLLQSTAAQPRLVGGRFLPRELLDSITRLERRARESTQIHAFRDNLETLSGNTFLLLTLLTLFLAMWVGLAMARTISEPVRALAKAAQRVGMGDLEVKLPVQGEDELALLSSRFNAMTHDLRQNREAIEAQAERIEGQRAYLGQLLEALPVGVMGWNAEGELRTFNSIARRWLGMEEWAPSLETSWREWAQRPQMGELPQLVDDVRATRRAQERELRLGGEGEDGRPVRAMVVALREGGELAVLEDLSLLAQAEKRAAWQEAARRMAHEVKNPLTPIQLTAQRLLRRGREGRLDPQLVREGAETILTEVASLSRLVESFSRFAKLPAPQPHSLDACELMRQVEALYAPAHPAIAFRLDVPDHPVEAVWDGDMVKRALINYVDNAVSALEHLPTAAAPLVTLRLDVEGDRAHLAVDNNGASVPESLRSRLFEPYVSTKRQGTGLGLAIAQRIAQDHGGEARYEPLEIGSRFSLVLPLQRGGTLG